MQGASYHIRPFVFFIATGAGSVAINLTIATTPHLEQYHWLVKYVWLVCLASWVVWIAAHKAVRVKVAGWIGGDALPTPATVAMQLQPLDIQLASSTGPSAEIVAMVTNRGEPREMSARCTITALRVGGRAHQFSTRAFDLKWENETARIVRVGMHPRNLLIATVDEQRSKGLPTMRIWGLSDGTAKEYEWQSWNAEPDEELPEYDLEISIYTDGVLPHSESFTLRPKSWLGPLEMVSAAHVSESLGRNPLLPNDPRMTIDVEPSGGMGLFPTTGIRVNNVGGSEMQSLKLNDLVIGGKTVRFESNVPTIPSGKHQTIYPIIDSAFLQQKRNLLGVMLEDWDNQGGLKADKLKLVFPASATYQDYNGNSYIAEWTYELYPMKYRMARMRELKRTGGVVPDTSGPYLLVPSVKTKKAMQHRQ